ncbi:hypothetical protein [Clostridium perfringens]|nr:hypothetical protein [Clostridium perfringens]MDM0719875.1 hypothetical protein [Clostridium perfringens]MDM0935655.1 hypothetical protein [Clostridium perfringens]
MKLLNLYFLLSFSMFIIPIIIAGGIYAITKFLPKSEGIINYEEF